MNWKEKLKRYPFPAWLFALVTVLYCETVLHIWITESWSLVRFGAVALFALGFGSVLGLLASFVSSKNWGKWVTFGVMFLISAFYIVEYFVNISYMSFMPIDVLLDGAAGVATDFGDVVIDLIVADFWRILVMLLPVIAYGFMGKPRKTRKSVRIRLVSVAVCAYLLAYWLVMVAGVDASRLNTTYSFDNAIRCFGLNMGMVLNTVNGSGAEEGQGEFVVLEPQPTLPVPTEAPEKAVEETAQTTEPAVVYQPNVLDIDFAALAENEKSTRISNIHKYVNSVQPTMQNEMTGLFKGKNLILITAEAFAAEVIDPELTPTLYRLANEGIQFKDFYQPMWGGSTSSGEFSILTGLVSANGTYSIHESHQQDLFLSIGKQLQKAGYFSAAYHNHYYTFYDRHETHTHYGYDTFTGLRNGLEEGVVEQWPQSDLEMMDFTVPQYIGNQPFSVYYMTVSGHCRYNFLGNHMSKKNEEKVQHLDCSDTLKAYYACQLELEYALESLVRQLEEAGIADDTVIVLCTDHYPYGLEKTSTWGNTKDYIAEMYGYDPKSLAERDHNALIIWSGSIEDMDLVIEDPVYSLDILPTLSNLFGVEYDSRLLVGRDVFSDAEPIVLWYSYTWKTDKGYYDAENGKFYPNEGVEVDDAYIERIKNIVYNKIYYSREVQHVDYFNYLVKEIQ